MFMAVSEWRLAPSAQAGADSLGVVRGRRRSHGGGHRRVGGRFLLVDVTVRRGHDVTDRRHQPGGAVHGVGVSGQLRGLLPGDGSRERARRVHHGEQCRPLGAAASLCLAGRLLGGTGTGTGVGPAVAAVPTAPGWESRAASRSAAVSSRRLVVSGRRRTQPGRRAIGGPCGVVGEQRSTAAASSTAAAETCRRSAVPPHRLRTPTTGGQH